MYFYIPGHGISSHINFYRMQNQTIDIKINFYGYHKKEIIFLLLLIRERKKNFLSKDIIRYKISSYLKKPNLKFISNFKDLEIFGIRKITINNLTKNLKNDYILKSHNKMLDNVSYDDNKYCMMNIPLIESRSFDFNISNMLKVINSIQILSELKRETDRYFKIEDFVFINKKRNYPFTSEQYIRKIIELAINIKIHGKETSEKDFIIIKNGIEGFEIVKLKKECFFDFINMIFTKDKLYMSRHDSIQLCQFHKIEIYRKAMKLIKDIKFYTTPIKNLNLTLIPLKLNKTYEEIDIELELKMVVSYKK